ncbi:MAG: hypothetical protein AAFW60_11180 [Pseudomonadota bacterium]
MLAVRQYIQEIFCATWSTRRKLNRDELTRALNHRSHRRWMVRYLERKSNLARLNLVVWFSFIVDWCEHHMNLRTKRTLNKAWLSAPKQALEHARQALRHDSRDVREDGLAILAYFEDVSSLSLIRSLFNHKDPHTRYQAQLAARAIEQKHPLIFVAPSFARGAG